MKILIIRHGDPDYEHDSLTETGWKEAELLSNRLTKMDIKDFYVSPLGRAKDTAKCTLEKMGRTAEEKEWLQEFRPSIKRPNIPEEEKGCIWDWLPQDWTKEPRFFDMDQWTQVKEMQEADINIREEYERVCTGLDELLTSHGYVRENKYYRVEKANNDTIILFCHFGLECILLSHLLNIPPMLLLHGMAAAPTSVTTLNTEERRKGIAYFRMSSFGDISHLYVAGQEPSKAARFCECYDNEEERHD